MSVTNFYCHPERRGRRGDRGVEGSLWSADGASSEFLAAHLREVREGRPLSADIAGQFLRCDDELLPELLATARSLKQQYRPGVVTYSRKVFIPLTNLCRDYCGYCTYRRDPGEPGVYTMTPDEVLSVAQQGEKLDCTEALFSLGDRPEARGFPRCAKPCASSAIAVRCIICKPCANWFCVKPGCCPTPIPAC